MEEKQTLPQLFEKYLQYCIVIRNYSPITIQGYKSTLNLFFHETQCLLPEQVTKNIVENWFFNGRLNRKWGAVTFSHYHKHLNKFFDWLLKQNIIAINPALQIEKPRLEQKLPRTVSKAQGQLILDTSYHMKYSYTFERYRNHAIIGLMLLAGLRKGEILKLRLQDVSIDTKTIFINQGKGHKDRMIPINLTLQRLLVEYLKDRTRLKRKSIFFFTTLQKDAPISNQCIKLLIHKLRKKTKIDFSSHTLRHGFARLMLEGGCDIYTLSKLMGHNKITTTTIYLSCSSQQMSKSIEMHALN
jgi:site-specific recombinase XerD